MRQGVIFDMDGVLVDSGPAHIASWRVLAKQHDVTMSDEEFSRCFGRTSRDIIRRLWGDRVPNDQISRIDDEKEAIYRASISGQIPLMPDMQAMLMNLSQAGLVLAVATSGPRENVALVLEQAELRSFFDAVVTGDDIEHGKPAPDCFLLAARQAGLEPSACVVLEDALVGIQAAVAAGMLPIGYVGTHPAQRLLDAGAVLAASKLSKITPPPDQRLTEPGSALTTRGPG